jgi:hypothetical protein
MASVRTVSRQDGGSVKERSVGRIERKLERKRARTFLGSICMTKISSEGEICVSFAKVSGTKEPTRKDGLHPPNHSEQMAFLFERVKERRR